MDNTTAPPTVSASAQSPAAVPVYYCNAAELQSAIEAYSVATGAEAAERLEDIITRYVMPMAEGVVARYFWHCGHDEQEDIIQAALIRVASVLNRWTPERGKAFNFLTTIIRNKGRDECSREATLARHKAIDIEHATTGWRSGVMEPDVAEARKQMLSQGSYRTAPEGWVPSSRCRPDRQSG